nr:unnamed protein product [Callosobruchus chinensis]
MQNMMRLMNKMFLNLQTLNGTQNMCVKANTCFKL